MKQYEINDLVRTIRGGSVPVILFGAGQYGKIAHYALRQRGISTSFFCDSDPKKDGTFFCGVKVILPEALSALGPDCHVFISCNYITPVVSTLNSLNLLNVYDCVALVEGVDFTGTDIGMSQSQIAVWKVRYKAACTILDAANADRLIIRGMDLVITEACTMKCKDCSNLMQYYTAPKTSTPETVLRPFDRMARCVDVFHEVRVLGGEPFVNKRIHEIINPLVAYSNVERVAIFTNATIVPQNANLACLTHKKVYLDITNYGSLSKNHDKLIEVLKGNNIAYTTHIPQSWTDSAKIEYKERPAAEGAKMFSRCCVNDVLTLLNGKLYRCPFSANAMNLKAIPQVAQDFVDLADERKDRSEIRRELLDLSGPRAYISACLYCNGRDYTTAKVTPAIQTKSPLPLKTIFSGQNDL